VCWREPRDNPWLMLPLQAAYQHVPKTAAAWTGRPRSILVCFEQQGAAHIERGRIFRDRNAAVRSVAPMSRQGAALMPDRSKPRSKSDRQAARLRGNPPDLRGAAAKIRISPSAHTFSPKDKAVPLPASALDRGGAGLVRL